MNSFWDRLGISASILCAIHCFATPVLVLSMPAIGGFFSHAAFHWVVAAVIFPIAVFALWLGYREHRYTKMLWLGGAGLVLMASAISVEPGTIYETIGMVAAGMLLSMAHYLNLQACRGLRFATQAQSARPHDRSSAATGTHRAPDSPKPENV
jgi:hypothetical protein